MKNFKTEELEKVLKTRFFISQTASIYGGVAGLYDLGPTMFGFKQQLLEVWRKMFVVEENLLEMESSILLPYNVLKASGHVDRFCDILICDEVNQLSYRADHYITEALEKKKNNKNKNEIEEVLKRVDCMSCKEIDEVMAKYNIKTPDGNNFSKATNFNLMFGTTIGFNPGQQVFLRPETAQGQFLNFKKLYESNFRKFPFGSATIGKAFRNEISPRSGLLRVREFDQAEIEYFVAPGKKDFKKFSTVKDLQLPLHFKDSDHLMVLGEAVEKGIIANEILAYFIARTYLFLVRIGMDPKLLRFRQHKEDEMAHYASDCWDCELFSSNGWVECVGIADRSAYDLTCHSKASKVDLTFKTVLEKPYEVTRWTPVLDKKKFIRTLKNKYESFKTSVEALSAEWCEENRKTRKDVSSFINYEFEGQVFEIDVEKQVRKVVEENHIPDVIEPSFGIGRILTILLEHTFYVRESGRSSFKLPSYMCYTKVMISYLIHNEAYEEYIEELTKQLKERDIVCVYNRRSCSIGKKYVYSDELGIPFFVTFDDTFIETKTVTIRERDSMQQIRVKIEEVPKVISDMLSCRDAFPSLKEFGEII
ncbi:Glycine--tRNA ligase [Nosema granulosis]|uniref:glycine--tRNA ligase n=1 Tax=Nosema granulosis TaxID=83296 RepID=A0A9P6GZQ9_9MICR|nr:Glycine--tRNA ligase [Nosema granulosis]